MDAQAWRLLGCFILELLYDPKERYSFIREMPFESDSLYGPMMDIRIGSVMYGCPVSS